MGTLPYDCDQSTASCCQYRGTTFCYYHLGTTSSYPYKDTTPCCCHLGTTPGGCDLGTAPLCRHWGTTPNNDHTRAAPGCSQKGTTPWYCPPGTTCCCHLHEATLRMQPWRITRLPSIGHTILLLSLATALCYDYLATNTLVLYDSSLLLTPRPPTAVTWEQLLTARGAQHLATTTKARQCVLATSGKSPYSYCLANLILS